MDDPALLMIVQDTIGSCLGFCFDCPSPEDLVTQQHCKQLYRHIDHGCDPNF